MARQMMKESMPELDKLQEKEAQKKETNGKDGYRLIGCKKITLKDLNRDVYPSSRFRQVKQRNLNLLNKGVLTLDKSKVKATLLSLRRANQEMLKAQNITTAIDDYVYLSVVFNQSITKIDPTVKVPAPTPVQIALPVPLKYEDCCFICRTEADVDKFQELFFDIGLDSIKIFSLDDKKALKPSSLSQFDHLMIDSTIKTPKILLKKRHFAFPITVKNKPSALVKDQIEQSLKASQFLLHSGNAFQAFEMKVAQTESMGVKEAVKNVMNGMVDLSSLVLYAARVPGCWVNEVHLSTSKSMALPIMLKEDTQRENDGGDQE